MAGSNFKIAVSRGDNRLSYFDNIVRLKSIENVDVIGVDADELTEGRIN